MMVIDFLNINLLTDPIQFQSPSEIALEVGTDFNGTDMDDVRRLNKDRRVLACAPSVEFDTKKIQRNFTEILEDVNAKNPRRRLPVIAWVIVGETIFDKSCHAVVITHVDRDEGKHEITYIDPYWGQKTVDLDKFSNQWDEADKWLIRLKFGRRQEKQMEAFS
jgi:hypothetical protein